MKNTIAALLVVIVAVSTFSTITIIPLAAQATTEGAATRSKFL